MMKQMYSFDGLIVIWVLSLLFMETSAFSFVFCPDPCNCTHDCLCVGYCENETLTTTETSAQPTLDPYNNSSYVCSDRYRTRDASERSCNNGFKCKYGVCIEDEDGGARCECDPGATSPQCTEKCCRDCGENGDCFLDEDNTELCNCHYNFTGTHCEALKPQETTPEPQIEETVEWRVLGAVCAAVFGVVLLSSALLLYWMWRHRVIVVMKIVHLFQGYEDDDDREWDAFISYKSVTRDEHFVRHVLYPKLEEELGFKLNIHFKDFIPGEVISNNIIKSIQSSRRTILVITPDFLKSEYTRLEYQMAQQEMLKRRHRIIPVLLDDISEYESTMDPNLKSILTSVTYLEWPNDTSNEKKLAKFWKRMQLSLPKKRPSVNGRSETATTPNEIHVAVEPMTNEFTKGFVYNNNAYNIEPEDPYDTLNENEIDYATKFK